MKSFILPFLLSLSLYGAVSDFLGGELCQYEKNSILYRDTVSVDNVVTLRLQLQSADRNSLCREINFGKSFSSNRELSSRDSALLSFIFDEYLGYSLPISSSSKIVKRLLNFNEFKAIQDRKKREIEKLIIDMGFSLEEIQRFRDEVLSRLSLVDIYCLDFFTLFYKDEVEKLNMLKEYARLFYDYKLNSEISDMVFKEIIQNRTEYLDSLKKVFIISISESM